MIVNDNVDEPSTPSFGTWTVGIATETIGPATESTPSESGVETEPIADEPITEDLSDATDQSQTTPVANGHVREKMLADKTALQLITSACHAMTAKVCDEIEKSKHQSANEAVDQSWPMALGLPRPGLLYSWQAMIDNDDDINDDDDSQLLFGPVCV